MSAVVLKNVVFVLAVKPGKCLRRNIGAISEADQLIPPLMLF